MNKENFYQWKEQVKNILIKEYGWNEDSVDLDEEEVFANLFVEDIDIAAERIASFFVDRAEDEMAFPA